MPWLLILFSLFAIWAGSNLWSLYKNYLSARKTGLPIVICPVNPYHPLWLIFSVPLRPLFEKYLPAWIYRRLNLAIYGFEFRGKMDVFGDKGPAFVLVTCGANELSLMDPELAVEVLKRIKDFPNTDIGNVIVGLFGPNLITSGGDSWARQRKLIAPNINEKVSRLVFVESCKQAREMLSSYVGELGGVTDDTMRGMKTIAINVLGVAGFGISRPWKEEKASRPKGYHMTYMEATKTVVECIVESAVLPAKLLTLPFFGPSWQDIGHAKNEFPLHTKEMLQTERKLQAESSEPRNHFLSMLARQSDPESASSTAADEKSNNTTPTTTTQVLSEDEILGNLFLFSSAGFDTTANTMAYALALLVAYPEWQEWLHEEIKEVVGDKDLESLEYADVYPRLPRCLALLVSENIFDRGRERANSPGKKLCRKKAFILNELSCLEGGCWKTRKITCRPKGLTHLSKIQFETMRFFPPLTHLAKQTNSDHDVAITTLSGRDYYIPKGTTLYINTVALHLSPETWGADASEFRPTRWLVDPSLSPSSSSAASDSTVSSYTIANNIRTMPKGTFLPWSTGPRVCPGMKMSQVEFVGVFLTLFARHRCEAVPAHEGETRDQVRARIDAIMQDSQPRLTLQMSRNRDLKVKWVKR